MRKKKKSIGIPPFAKTLRSLMTEKGISVRRAAESAGVATSTVDDWRAGTTPADYLAVKRLARALGVSFSFLLTGEDEENRAPTTVTEVFSDGGILFDGYAKISIQRLVPRNGSGKGSQE